MDEELHCCSQSKQPMEKFGNDSSFGDWSRKRPTRCAATAAYRARRRRRRWPAAPSASTRRRPTASRRCCCASGSARRSRATTAPTRPNAPSRSTSRRPAKRNRSARLFFSFLSFSFFFFNFPPLVPRLVRFHWMDFPWLSLLLFFFCDAFELIFHGFLLSLNLRLG